MVNHNSEFTSVEEKVGKEEAKYSWRMLDKMKQARARRQKTCLVGVRQEQASKSKTCLVGVRQEQASKSKKAEDLPGG